MKNQATGFNTTKDLIVNVKAHRDAQVKKQAIWRQVQLFSNSEIQDRYGNYGKPEVLNESSNENIGK